MNDDGEKIRLRSTACSAFATFRHNDSAKGVNLQLSLSRLPHRLNDDESLDTVRRGEIQPNGSEGIRPDGKMFRMTTDSQKV
jgi:hypothetical protein